MLSGSAGTWIAIILNVITAAGAAAYSAQHGGDPTSAILAVLAGINAVLHPATGPMTVSPTVTVPAVPTVTAVPVVPVEAPKA